MARKIDFTEPANAAKDRNNLLAMTAEANIKGLLYGEATKNPSSLVSAPYDLVDLTVTGYVQAADTVEIRVQNESGSTADLASGTWRALVFSRTA